MKKDKRRRKNKKTKRRSSLRTTCHWNSSIKCLICSFISWPMSIPQTEAQKKTQKSKNWSESPLRTSLLLWERLLMKSFTKSLIMTSITNSLLLWQNYYNFCSLISEQKKIQEEQIRNQTKTLRKTLLTKLNTSKCLKSSRTLFTSLKTVHKTSNLIDMKLLTDSDFYSLIWINQSLQKVMRLKLWTRFWIKKQYLERRRFWEITLKMQFVHIGLKS